MLSHIPHSIRERPEIYGCIGVQRLFGLQAKRICDNWKTMVIEPVNPFQRWYGVVVAEGVKRRMRWEMWIMEIPQKIPE